MSLVLASLLAWWWLWDHRAMAAMAMPYDPMSVPVLLAAILMWVLMMVAMMLPSALPMILLHAKLAKQTVPAGLFALSYVAVWASASIIAAIAQQGLIAGGLLNAMTLAFGNRGVAGVVLVLAGAYQLTPFKYHCLDKCRTPLSFLMRHWRPGSAGALRLGVLHGAYCLGCCWLLMALLFVGGVMNLAWVALLAIFVLAEKTLPVGPRFVRVTGVFAIMAGLFMFLAHQTL